MDGSISRLMTCTHILDGGWSESPSLTCWQRCYVGSNPILDNKSNPTRIAMFGFYIPLLLKAQGGILIPTWQTIYFRAIILLSVKIERRAQWTSWLSFKQWLGLQLRFSLVQRLSVNCTITHELPTNVQLVGDLFLVDKIYICVIYYHCCSQKGAISWGIFNQ